MIDLDFSKWQEFIIYLYNKRKKVISITLLSDNTNTTYSHTKEILHFLKLYKLIVMSDINGRTKRIILTNRGIKVGRLLNSVEMIL